MMCDCFHERISCFVLFFSEEKGKYSPAGQPRNGIPCIRRSRETTENRTYWQLWKTDLCDRAYRWRTARQENSQRFLSRLVRIRSAVLLQEESALSAGGCMRQRLR